MKYYKKNKINLILMLILLFPACNTQEQDENDQILKSETLEKEKSNTENLKFTKENIIQTIISEDETKLPNLMKAFEVEQNEMKKSLYASLIIRIGSNDSKYWNYIYSKSLEVLENKIPEPFIQTEDGLKKTDKYSPEFIKWCEDVGANPKIAAGKYYYTNPSIIKFLGLTNDTRAFELLKRGINSENNLIVRGAVDGLGILGDKRGIELIVEVCERSENKKSIPFIIEALVFIDDPKAQEIAKDNIDEEYYNFLRKQASERNYKALLQLF
ncbi:MAG: HEAT repeat domain-containing protein [Thermodesulfobacteriota bacterium]